MGRGMPNGRKVVNLLIAQGSWDAPKTNSFGFVHRTWGRGMQKNVNCWIVHCTRFVGCQQIKKLWIVVFCLLTTLVFGLSSSFPFPSPSPSPPSLQRFSPKVSPKSFPQKVFDGDGDSNDDNTDDDDDEDDDEIQHSVADLD